MDVKDRINKYIDLKGINVFSFEKSIGCSNGYWRKTKSISANILSEITRVYPDLSIEWAITGNGDIFKSDINHTIKDRLRLFIENNGLTEPEFCRSINIPLSYYDKIENEVSEKNLKDMLERYPRLNIEWLTTGEGSMHRRMLPINNRILVIVNKKYDDDPFKMCKAIGVDESVMIPILFNNDNPSSDIINLFAKKTGVSSNWLIHGEGDIFQRDTPIQSSAISEEPKKSSIPYYDNLPVSAGQQDLASSGNNEVPSGWINIPGVSAEGLFPVVGCSMKPEINPGDVVGLSAVNRWDIVDPDKIYMIVTNDDRMIKHLATDDDDREILWCISPNYNKFSIRKEEIKFIYRVTFHGRMV